MFFNTPLSDVNELEISIKLLLAALAGGLVGLEREKHGRPAGLRTNLLVAVGSCVMMIISESFFLKYAMHGVESTLRLDPSRVAAQIVTGIGFLGAGVIIKEGATVRGLTTAASLWVVAGLGMAFGVGFYSLGAIATMLVLVSLIFLKKLDPVIRKDHYLVVTVTAQNQDGFFDRLLELFKKRKLYIADVSSTIDLENDEITLRLVITQQKKRIGKELTQEISLLSGVKKIQYR
ncbi:MAG: MgtC/SapB family protein [Desulfuromonadales bacterium]|nr:MgtC/SapB family protein [Desulfuromonadales bacterium]